MNPVDSDSCRGNYDCGIPSNNDVDCVPTCDAGLAVRYVRGRWSAAHRVCVRMGDCPSLHDRTGCVHECESCTMAAARGIQKGA